MDYVKHFDINGVATRQAGCIELHGKPNAATVGCVGVLGIDVDSPTYEVYKCVAVNGAIYTWELLSSGMSMISSTLTSGGVAFMQFPYAQLQTPSLYVVKIGDLILDRYGYLYQVTALYSSYCDAKYCDIQIVAHCPSGVYLGTETPPEGVEVWVDPRCESGETEEWIFTLEDGTIVTKKQLSIDAQMKILRLKNAEGKWVEVPALIGAKGDTGVGIESIEQTTTSTEDGGDNIITITLTNGQTVTLTVQNGSKGRTGEVDYSRIDEHNDSTEAHSDIREAVSSARALAEAAQNTANGKEASGTAERTVSSHNTNTDAHNDIRLLIEGLTSRLNVLANSDDTTLDQMAEVVAYIKANRDLIDQITTGKVSVGDIVNNLVTNVANKPLSAAQGVALKALIDAITVPTKVSQLENDSKYLTGYTETDPNVPAWAKAPNKPSYTADEVGARPNTWTPSAADVGALPISGGTMTGELRVNGGDVVGGSKIVLETGKGQITSSNTQTLFGFTAASTMAVGHSSYIMALRGSGARPKYNSADMALLSDIPSVPTLSTETWTFTLEDGSKVTKAVYIG